MHFRPQQEPAPYGRIKPVDYAHARTYLGKVGSMLGAAKLIRFSPGGLKAGVTKG